MTDFCPLVQSTSINVTAKLKKRAAHKEVSHPTSSEIIIETMSVTSDSTLNSESELEVFVPPKTTLKRFQLEESFDGSASSSKLPASKKTRRVILLLILLLHMTVLGSLIVVLHYSLPRYWRIFPSLIQPMNLQISS